MEKHLSILATMAIGLIAVLSCTKDDADDIPSAPKSIMAEQSTVSSFTASITGRFIGVDKADLALGRRGMFYCLKTADAEKQFNSWLEGNDNPGCMMLDRVTVESEKIYCTLEGLFPDTEYSYCLYLQKRDGTREISAVSSFRTQPFNPEIGEASLNGVQCFVAFAEGGIVINPKDAANCETGIIVSGQNDCNISNSTAYSCNIEDDNTVRARIRDRIVTCASGDTVGRLFYGQKNRYMLFETTMYANMTPLLQDLDFRESNDWGGRRVLSRICPIFITRKI